MTEGLWISLQIPGQLRKGVQYLNFEFEIVPNLEIDLQFFKLKFLDGGAVTYSLVMSGQLRIRVQKLKKVV